MSAKEQLADAREIALRMRAADACTRSLGIEVEVPAMGEAVASMVVRPDMLNGFGICHGGIIFTLADTALAFACNTAGEETLSAAASIDWLAAVQRGERLRATARRDQSRGRHGFYTVEVRNSSDELVAMFRGHAVRSGRPLDGGGQK